jgi:hypothetical protein
MKMPTSEEMEALQGIQARLHGTLEARPTDKLLVSKNVSGRLLPGHLHWRIA